MFQSSQEGGKAKEEKEDKKKKKKRWKAGGSTDTRMPSYAHTLIECRRLYLIHTEASSARVFTSNTGRGVFLSPPEPAEIYSQAPQDKW